MHLRQARSTYSAWGPFTRNKERMEKLKATAESNLYLTKRAR